MLCHKKNIEVEKKLSGTRYCLILFCFLVLLALLSCSEDKPTAPGETGSDFGTVYFTNLLGDSTFYSFDTHEMKLDSFYLPFKPERGMFLKSNKNDMILCFRDSVVVVNLDTKAVTKFPDPIKGKIVFSPDEKYYSASIDGALHFFNAADNSIYWADTFQTQFGCFSVDGNYYYSFYYNVISVFDLIKNELVKKSYMGEYVSDIEATKDKDVVLIRTTIDYGNALAIYNLESESILFSDRIGYEYGEIEVAPDLAYAYFTYGGLSVGMGGPAPETFRIYDLTNYSLYQEVSTAGFIDDPDIVSEALTSIAITGNNKYLVGYRYDEKFLIFYDIEEKSLDSFYLFENIDRIHFYGL